MSALGGRRRAARRRRLSVNLSAVIRQRLTNSSYIRRATGGCLRRRGDLSSRAFPGSGRRSGLGSSPSSRARRPASNISPPRSGEVALAVNFVTRAIGVAAEISMKREMSESAARHFAASIMAISSASTRHSRRMPRGAVARVRPSGNRGQSSARHLKLRRDDSKTRRER